MKNNKRKQSRLNMFGFDTMVNSNSYMRFVEPHVGRAEAIYNELLASGKLKDSPFTKEQLIKEIRRELISEEGPVDIIKEKEKQSSSRLRKELKLIKLRLNVILKGLKSSSDRYHERSIISRLDGIYNELLSLKHERFNEGSLRLFNSLVRQIEEAKNKIEPTKRVIIPFGINIPRFELTRTCTPVSQLIKLPGEPFVCPKCGRKNTERIRMCHEELGIARYKCNNCGYVFNIRYNQRTQVRPSVLQTREYPTYEYSKSKPYIIQEEWYRRF